MSGEARTDSICAVAVIGCAGRFPGAPDVATFWKNLSSGVESIRTLDPAQLEDAASPQTRAASDYVGARAIVDGVAEFDAPFFGMHAREAELTDPQHRVFLESCWQALEDAGYDPATYPGTIGVYAGSSLGSYLLRNVLADRTGLETFTNEYQVGSMAELIGSGYDFLATRVAYKLDLRGPALTLQTACSTSLLAVAQACQALMLRQADMMLAGGVSITFPQLRGYLHQDGGMVSADGHCRTFDARATGTVFGDGCGVVLLKRLEDALADGDAIYAVVRGFGINNDGSRKAGYTVPSIEGQLAAIRAAHAMARFEAESIGFVECHGTATPLGDPIEVTALNRAFAGATTSQSCALGSLKTNVGHLDVASGIAGFIKAALSVRSGTIPPTLHFENPNPELDFTSGPFFVNTETIAWPNAAPLRRAAVSSFGLGGTNVHVVLEAAPRQEPRALSGDPQLLVLSARSEAALRTASAQLARYLRESDARLDDVAYTLQAGRRHFPHRLTLVASSLSEAADRLERNGAVTSLARERPRQIAFMFPGQGSQYAGMGRDLYVRVPSFRATIDRCADILTGHGVADLGALLHGEAGDLTSTDSAQPAIFALEYALAELLRSYGIEPVAAVGHSVGEFVAACLAGVISLEDALGLVAERGRLIRRLSPGAMLAVRAGAQQLDALLEAGLDIAALNAPEMSVVSGPVEAIARFAQRLEADGILQRRLHTSHAFHSSMMDPVIEPLAGRVSVTPLSAPTMPYVSTVSGSWITSEQATSPEYWARHCRETVRFGAAVQTLVDAGIDALVEVGPGSTLATLALQGAAKGGRATVYTSLPTSERERPNLEFLLESLGRMWADGATLDWNALHGGARLSRVSLPTYPFERTKHWIAPFTAASEAQSPAASPPAALPPAQPPVISNLAAELVALLEDLSGESLSGAPANATFLELGFDSLFLGRVVQQIRTRFGVAVSFRQLLGEIPSLAALTEYVAARRPVAPSPSGAATVGAPPAQVAAKGSVEELMAQQLEAMQRLVTEQLAALKSIGTPSASGRASGGVDTQAAPPEDAPSRFEAFRVGSGAKGELTERQRAHIRDLVERVVARTPESKRLTERYRSVLADPRVAAGFRSEWKEMVYPIACARAKGARLWDVDGNEYVDLLNGFGQTAFGHAPDFVLDAVHEQLERGFAIGPQADLAGEVAELFCELTGNERMTFCNTGSEAVMAALRVARTVTGRERIVVFDGSYHGQFDEVLVKSATSSHRSLPVALGIPAESVANVTVLRYGAAESLTWIREHAAELAAIVVESVQSRHPALRPIEFLRELRSITEESGAALVFDEVVTGFRMHPGGMQAIFGIRADLATYGKVVGGGLPVGILAGKASYMDALDGGAWNFGDDSFPQVAPTFFAGTFVRHPLALAAMLAVLRHIKAHGPRLQEALSDKTALLVDRLNAEFERRGIASRIESYGSLFYFNPAAEDRLASLLFYHLRLRGVYLQEGFPCFLTTEHGDAEIAQVVAALGESLDELQAAGILPQTASVAEVAQGSLEFPLTDEQREIWMAAQMGDEASCAFNESVTLRLRGPLDEAAFAQAWKLVLTRHDALRSCFGTTGQMMKLASAASLDVSERDLSSVAATEREEQLRRFVDADARTPFDLARGPLVRATLFDFSSDEYVFVLTAHHIVCDGWSMNVVLSELAHSYQSLRLGKAPTLAAALPFSTYARAQAARDPQAHADVERFWLEQFKELPPLLELPLDRPRPSHKTYRGATRTAWIEREQYLGVKKTASRQGCTLFAILLAAFETLVGRLGDQNDIVVGVPAAGQALLEDVPLVGHCVDFLPLRGRWTSSTTFTQLLADVKTHVLDAYDHQQYTLGTLVRRLAPVRESNRTPLAEVQFNLERLAEDLPFGGLAAELEPNPKAFVNFDLFFNVVESAEGLRIDCDYNTDLFDASTIDRWLGYYRTILDEIERDPEQTVSGFDYRSVVDRELLAGLNETTMEYPRESTIGELFDASAKRYATAPAIRFGQSVVTYAELRLQTDRLARELLTRGIAPGQRLAVCVERSPALVAALLGTLKAGCSYVPLDPLHPPARLRRIVEDAGVSAILVYGSADPAIAPAGVPLLDIRELLAGGVAESPAATAVGPSDPAYIIYTSGSTGAPKGVAVAHRSLVNLLTSFAQSLGLRERDELLALTTVSFDIAGLELFLPLICGATVRIASRDEIADPFALVRKLNEPEVTAVQATPALWTILLEVGFQSRAGLTMLSGGEALPFELAQRLLAGGGTLYNVYGPTETTIWSSCARIRAAESPITVGTPIANTQFYVLDSNERVVAPGVVGQLHIAGDGVALEYVGNPQLTAERFVPNPFGQGRMYRTGDAARVLPNGEVQILGRLDHQVKLRGFRIEPGEIEAALLAGGAVSAATVLLREDTPGEKRLVCYYTGAAVDTSESSLRALLGQQLPDYMIPTRWVALERMPLTPAGKVDRAVLPVPDPALAAHEFSAPETEGELALARIWADVLQLERVGRDDDFLALGGDSIQVFQITARANETGLRIAAKDLLRLRTIAALARHLEENPPLPEVSPFAPPKFSVRREAAVS